MNLFDLCEEVQLEGKIDVSYVDDKDRITNIFRGSGNELYRFLNEIDEEFQDFNISYMFCEGNTLHIELIEDY